GATVDARVGLVHVRRERLAPRSRVVGRAQRAGHVVERETVDADRRREDGDVAGERFEDGEAEALGVAGDEDGVGGVDVQRDLVATRSIRGIAVSVIRLVRGWRTSLPCSVRTRLAPRTASAGSAASP